MARGEKAAGKGNDRQVRSENSSIRNTEGRGGSHGIIQTGLHDEAGDRKPGARDERGEHPGNTDAADDAHLRRAPPAKQRRKALRHGHMGRTDKQAKKACREHGKRKKADDQFFFSAVVQEEFSVLSEGDP